MTSNPFEQSPYNWEIKVKINAAQQMVLQDFFENYTDTSSIFEIDPSNYELNIYFNYEPDLTKLLTDLKKIDQELESLNFQITKLDDVDWVSEVQKSFNPIDVANFYIYNSYNGTPYNDDLKINIKIDPGRAFGTGEHDTTKMCLLAISELNNNFYNILDLGCGSAILAIAAAKKFKDAQILAVDIDPIAVEVSSENCQINEEAKISLICSENIFVDSPQKFDLIIANILAQPLIDFANEIKDALLPNGKVILSGFLDHQSNQVVDTYTTLGFRLEKIYPSNNWHAVILQKD